MSNGVSNWLAGHRIDTEAAKVGLLLSVALFWLRFLASDVFIETVPIVLGLACIVYLVAARRTSFESRLVQVTGTVVEVLPALVVLGMACLVLLVRFAGERTLPFYALAGALGSLVLVQVLFAETDAVSPGLVLAQILGLSLVVRFAAFYATPGYVGIDVWTHAAVWTRAIVSSGSLAPMADTYYSTAPLYHVLVASASEVLGVSVRSALLLSLGLVLPLSALFVFPLTRTFVPTRWALFATALFVFSGEFIRWGIHLIPTSMGLVLWIATLYGVTYLFFSRDVRALVLVAFFGVAIVFTHQVSTFVVLALLGTGALVQVALWLATRGADTGRPGRGWRDVAASLGLVGVFLLVAAVTLLTWANTPYAGSTFLQVNLGLTANRLTGAGFLSLAKNSGGAPVAGELGGSTAAQVAAYIDVLGFLLLLFAAIVGSLVMLRRRHSRPATFTYVGIVVVLLAFAFVLPLFGVRNFVPGRWPAFAYCPMAVVGAIGLFRLSRSLSARAVLVVVVVFALVYPTAMVVTEKATLDHPALDGPYARYSYTEQELAAVHTIGRIRPSTGDNELYTDHPYRTLYRRLDGYGYDARILQVNGEGTVVTQGPTVYRQYQSTGAATFRGPGDPPFTGDPLRVPERDVCGPETNTVYANGDVRLCLPGGVSA